MIDDKCTVTDDGKIVNPCKALTRATEFGSPSGKRKGIWCWEYHGIKDPGPKRRFWGTKSGDFVEKGIAFNFCPFCGEKIEQPTILKAKNGI